MKFREHQTGGPETVQESVELAKVPDTPEQDGLCTRGVHGQTVGATPHRCGKRTAKADLVRRDLIGVVALSVGH